MAYHKVMTRRKVEAHRQLQALLGLTDVGLAKKPARRKPPPTLEEIVLKHIRRMRKA